MNPVGVTATAVATLATPTHDLVSDQACINCHGNHVWRGANHDVTSPQGVGACVVCHNRKGSADARLPGAGSGLMGIVHGIHNSKNMPDAQYTFTWTNGNQFNFSLGFPGYMNNCSTCHDSDARLSAAMAAPFSYGLCISCHDSFTAFPNAPTTGIFNHSAFTATQTCSPCHDSQNVAVIHNGQKTSETASSGPAPTSRSSRARSSSSPSPASPAPAPTTRSPGRQLQRRGRQPLQRRLRRRAGLHGRRRGCRHRQVGQQHAVHQGLRPGR